MVTMTMAMAVKGCYNVMFVKNKDTITACKVSACFRRKPTVMPRSLQIRMTRWPKTSVVRKGLLMQSVCAR